MPILPSGAAFLAVTLALLPQETPKPIAARPPAPPAKKAAPVVKLPPQVVARVNSRDITGTELLGAFTDFGGREMLQKLIQRALIEQEAKKYGVAVSDTELKAAVTEEKGRIVRGVIQQVQEPLTFADVTRRYGLTEAEVTWTKRLELLSRKAYEKYAETQVPTLAGQRKLAHILVATLPLGPSPDGQPPAPTTAEEQQKRDTEALQKIEDLQAQIKAKKLTFEDAAKQFSDDKGSGAQGGLLPFVGKGVYDPAFEKAGWALSAVGDVSPPIKSRFGYHLIKLLSKGETASPEERKAFREEQTARLLGDPQGYRNWLGILQKNATITLNPSAKIVPAAARPR
jgi:parvulin-like peptidyl-prolyl isomerase